MNAPRLATIDDAAPNISEGTGAGMEVFLEELGGPTMSARIGQEVLTARRSLGERCIDVTRGPSYPSPGGEQVTGGRYLLRDGGPGAPIIGALNFTLLGRGARAKAVVSNLVVASTHRRQGIATRLLDEMLSDHPAARADTSMTSLGAAFLGYGPSTAAAPAIPPALAALATLVRGKSFEAAKRAVVARVGSVQPRERFDDDVADAVFLRLQRVAQVGLNTDEAALAHRKARRLLGDGTITLYRAAPAGAGVRPGDFAAGSAHEAGFYRHSGNVIQSAEVPRSHVLVVEGSMGGGQEYVLLPPGHKAAEPEVHFADLKSFCAAVDLAAEASSPSTTPRRKARP